MHWAALVGGRRSGITNLGRGTIVPGLMDWGWWGPVLPFQGGLNCFLGLPLPGPAARASTCRAYSPSEVGTCDKGCVFDPHCAALQGQPEGARTHDGYDGLPPQAGCRPGMSRAGCRPGKRNSPGTVQTTLQGQNRPTESPTHHAQHRPIAPRNPDRPFRTHSLRTAGLTLHECDPGPLA